MASNQAHSLKEHNRYLTILEKLHKGITYNVGERTLHKPKYSSSKEHVSYELTFNARAARFSKSYTDVCLWIEIKGERPCLVVLRNRAADLLFDPEATQFRELFLVSDEDLRQGLMKCWDIFKYGKGNRLTKEYLALEYFLSYTWTKHRDDLINQAKAKKHAKQV